MPNLFELKSQRAHALAKADSILALSENAKRDLTSAEQSDVDNAMLVVKTLNPQIEKIESKNTLTTRFKELGGIGLLSGGVGANGRQGPLGNIQVPERILSADYVTSFFEHIASGGTKISAALSEGSDGAGGYAVPLVVSDQIVPLAVPDQGVISVATVIPTSMDIKIPQKGSFGVAGAKAESGGSDHTFPESDPTLSQISLSAFMAGIYNKISWELAQDVQNFQQFAVTDLLQAMAIYEGNKYVNGSGTGEPQGLIGNTGVGVTEAEEDTLGNLLSIDTTFAVLATLKTPYHLNASWLMSRETGVAIRRAQSQANLFMPVWTREGGQDFLHGYPVTFDSNMPAVAAGNTPVLFGDFKAGYVIGLRGGTGVNVKILDQPLALQGQIALLAYRRVDGRVRRSEAIQAITLEGSGS
jgi:HK97 family phage major capsid protein